MLKARPAARTTAGRAYVQTDRAGRSKSGPPPGVPTVLDFRSLTLPFIELARPKCIRLPRRLARPRVTCAAGSPIRRVRQRMGCGQRGRPGRRRMPRTPVAHPRCASRPGTAAHFSVLSGDVPAAMSTQARIACHEAPRPSSLPLNHERTPRPEPFPGGHRLLAVSITKLKCKGEQRYRRPLPVWAPGLLVRCGWHQV